LEPFFAARPNRWPRPEARNFRKKCDGPLTVEAAVAYIAVIDEALPATGRRRVPEAPKHLTDIW
jgi:hypothetical protein